MASSVSVASVLSLSSALRGEDVDVVWAGEVALDPLGEAELAGGAGGQDRADLAVGVAGQGAVTESRQAGDGDRLLGGGVLDREGEDHVAAGLGHGGRVGGLGDLDGRGDVGEVDRRVVVIGGVGVVVVDRPWPVKTLT